jgi:hypothetical protein
MLSKCTNRKNIREKKGKKNTEEEEEQQQHKLRTSCFLRTLLLYLK